MSRNWTPEQKTAIEARGGNLLVSAAAGSGKTAVLVERVIGRLTDSSQPCSPDQLLIVTFTNAAAAEMKQKIISAVSALAMKNPNRPNLIKLQIQIQNANISTMDSFCIKLVRENAAILGIEADFRVIQGGELSIMRSNALNETLDSLHNSDDESLLPLIEMFFKGSSDSPLGEAIESLYDHSCSYPFPQLWLKSIENMYTCDSPLVESAWGETILNEISSILDYSAALYDDMAGLVEEEGDEEVQKKAENILETIKFNILECRKLHAEKNWDALLLFSQNMDFLRMSLGKASPLTRVLGNKNNGIKDCLRSIDSLLCATEAEHKEDMAFLRPIVEGLIYGTSLFTENFKKLKSEANAMDFSDVLHNALNLLYTNTDGKLERTNLAIELSEQYKEVLIDEYQDTNEAQDLLFHGLSRNKQNMFMVGDVKQSIYGFRLANPGIFINHSKRPLYKDENYPAKVILGKNFRSRHGVLDGVNYIFSQIMSPRAGAVLYDESERLYCGRSDTKSEIPDTEIQFIDFQPQDSEKSTVKLRAESEAEHLAALIKKMVESKQIIEDNEGKRRPLNYGDFCILFRAKADLVYSETLSRHGIPSQTENSRSFFESREISHLLSLLRVIDNPLSDVELLSLLLSPFYGFTADEVAAMRIKDRHARLYDLLSLEKKEGNEKVSTLLADLQRYRSLSSIETAADFIRNLISETKYTSLLFPMGEAEKRRANVEIFISFAEEYDSYGTGGLAGFLRYINRLSRTDKESRSDRKLKSASLNPSGGNSVKLMTIHSSKGLEFPVVILAATTKGFNTRDATKSLTIHSKLGLGIQIQKPDEFKKYPSIGHAAIGNTISREQKSEEMRILYVALTRAREKLIVLATESNFDKKINELASLTVLDGKKISPHFVLEQSSFYLWLLMSCLRHPNGGAVLRERLEESAYLPEGFLLEDAAPINISLSPPLMYEEKEEEKVAPIEETEEERQEKEELLSLLHERIDYEYPYKALESLSSKYAASSLANTAADFETYALSKPNFLVGEIESGAEAGTAAHIFLQHCDFALAAKDIQDEIRRQTAEKRLSPQQAKAIRPEQLQAFFDSSLFARILAAEPAYREKRFSISLPALEIAPDLPPTLAEEKIFIQGITDLIFVENGEAVIVDYKTDRVKKAEDLIARYKAQLHIYKKTAEKVLGLPVKECYIYSLSLNEAILL